MPIMRDIKMTIATAIAAAGISTAAMAQDAHLENRADHQENTVQVVQDSASTGVSGDAMMTSLGVPKSKLSFEYSPDMIKDRAAQGQFLPVKLLTKPIDFEAFHVLNDRAADSNKAGVYIGVVVDSRMDNWPSEHLRDIHRRVTEIMLGDKEHGIKGAAELYGARVVGIIPIAYDPTDRKPWTGPPDAAGNETYIGIPVEVDDIILAINDVPAAMRKDGHYISTMNELEDWMVLSFAEGAHLYTYDEYKAYEDEIEQSRGTELAAYKEYYIRQEARRSSQVNRGGDGKSSSGSAEIATVALTNN